MAEAATDGRTDGKGLEATSSESFSAAADEDDRGRTQDGARKQVAAPADDG